MNDFGLTTALTNMYNGPSQAQQKNSEFAQIEQMSRFYEKENLEQEASAAKMQAYDKQVDDFADKLLAPDRKRLYERSRVMKSSVRDMIKENGGDMKQFFSSGGHQIMADYKASLVNSSESSDYLENKQNMAFILKAMNEGKGHLVSPKDKENFDRYMADGKGKITYGGVMNDIKMPDASKFRGGVSMKADDILNENMMAIASNYAMYYKGTSLDPANNNVAPTREELLSFTSMMYGSQIGSNYNIDIAKNQELRAQNQELRSQQMQSYDVQSKQIQNEGQVIQNDRNKVGIQSDIISQQVTLAELDANQRKLDEYSAKLENGTATAAEKTDAKAITDALTPSYESPFMDFYSEVNKFEANPNNANNAFKNLMNNNAKLKSMIGDKYSEQNMQRNYRGTGSFDFDMTGGFETKYSPTSAYIIKNDAMRENIAEYAGKIIMGSEYDPKSKIIKDWIPQKGDARIYHADGTSLKDRHPTMNESSDYDDVYKGNYKVQNVITAAVNESQGGKQIIMRAGDENVDAKLYDKKNKTRMSTFAVVKKDKDPFSPVFYVEVDLADTDKLGVLAKKTNDAEIRKNINIKNEKIQMIKSRDKIINDKNKKELYNLRTNKLWQATAYSITGTGNYGDTDFLNSYLAVASDSYKNTHTLDEVAKITSNSILTYINPEVYKNIKSKPNGAKIFFEDLIAKSKSPYEKELISRWMSAYFQLK